MAVAASASNVASLAPAEELSDAQMAELLAQANVRLHEKAKSQQVAKKEQKTSYTFPKLDTGALDKPYATAQGEIAKIDTARLLDERDRKRATGIRKVEHPLTSKKLAEERKKATSGPSWYHLPRTDLTPDLKRDLQLLNMRNVLDPHRHYKKEGGKMQAPEYSQVGTVVEGPTEFFTGRIENKKRKRTFVEEVLAGEQETGRFKKKYGDVQAKKTSGKKAFYKALKAKRHGGVKKWSG